MMRNKILSYILGGVFAVLLGSLGCVFADCQEDFQSCQYECANEYVGCDQFIHGRECSRQLASCNQICNDNKEECGKCYGIKLNTNFPIIGNCIETKAGAKTNPTNAFPYMLGVFTKIIMSVILVVCFILIIVAGIMWASSGDKAPSKAKELIKKVAITILLLGLSGLILKLINPNFFG